MSNNVRGKENRAASRDFHENNVQAGRDVISILLPDLPKTEIRPLVPAQRKQLNKLVKEIAEASNEEGFVVWQKVHAEVSVKNIDEITVDQYPNALNYLQSMLDRLRDGNDCKSLMHQLLKKTSENKVRQRLYEYCDISFGTRHLADLAKSQLQQALGWLCNDLTESEKIIPPPSSRLVWSELIRSYPTIIGPIFIFGIVIGAVIF
ncbi:hypothetical protein [Hafnia psychrotolerans]|uniref:Transmembrane protein n=1 Tax=Hafnia psychrotolerans TaxID=1477018 RepID=A0ABQ1GEF0_9GAMM|nr:hypothetical protein [Hafnia psychrotolerans]GGA42107.1 hypothetical protein GCM10011328_16430 [Hafnia psychrotolerans]